MDRAYAQTDMASVATFSGEGTWGSGVYYAAPLSNGNGRYFLRMDKFSLGLYFQTTYENRNVLIKAFNGGEIGEACESCNMLNGNIQIYRKKEVPGDDYLRMHINSVIQPASGNTYYSKNSLLYPGTTGETLAAISEFKWNEWEPTIFLRANGELYIRKRDYTGIFTIFKPNISKIKPYKIIKDPLDARHRKMVFVRLPNNDAYNPGKESINYVTTYSIRSEGAIFSSTDGGKMGFFINPKVYEANPTIATGNQRCIELLPAGANYPTYIWVSGGILVGNKGLIEFAANRKSFEGVPNSTTTSANALKGAEAEGIFDKNSEMPEGVTIGPNPASSVVNIQNNKREYIESISVFTADGRRVINNSVNNNETIYKISIDKLSKGIYVIKVKTDMKLYTKKLSIL